MNPNLAQDGAKYRFGNGIDAKKAQIKGAQKRRENKRAKTCFEQIAKAILYNAPPISKEQMEAFAKICDVPVSDLTVAHTIMAKQAQEAAEGNLAAAVFLRDTAGEKPAERVEAEFTQGDFVLEIGMPNGDDTT